MADSVTINIMRFDPSMDEKPHLETYVVPWQGASPDEVTDLMSLLQGLDYIYDNLAQIAYDFNCGAGLCGRCTIMVDGKPKLACWTKLEKGGNYTIEPLQGFDVVRDLIVDKRSTYDKYVRSDVEVQSRTPLTIPADIDYDLYWNVLEKFNLCLECMCCYAVCPKVQEGVTDKFIGPGAMMQIGMRYFDPFDEGDRAWQAAFSGVFECDLCGKCSSVCPASIDIVSVMNDLQKAALAEGVSAQPAVIPASLLAASQQIAEAKAAAANGSSSGPQTVSGTPEEIINSSCNTAGCHDAATILNYKTDADGAKLRVESHILNQVDLTDEQKAQFIEFFTK
jgi:succinate dehydrogenase/fumarate reductase iron-sulfur protein